MATRGSLEPSRKSLVIVSGGAACAFLACVLVGVVGFGKVSNARAVLHERESQVEDGRLIAKRLQMSELRYSEAQQELAYLERSTTTREYIPTLLKQIEGLAKSVNLKVTSVRPAAAPPEPPRRESGSEGEDAAAESKPAKPLYDEQRIDIHLEGSYSNALSFILRLNTFPKILTVNSVEASPLGGGERINPDRLNIKLNVTAFIMDEKPDEVAKADNPATFREKRKALSAVEEAGKPGEKQ